jgi:glucokinase
MNDSAPLVLGLDIGGTKCAALVGDASGAVLDRREWPSAVSRGPEAMIADLCTHGADLMERFGGRGRFRGIGVPVGGPLDAQQGVVHAPPNLPGWNAIPLRRIIEERLKLPAHVEHDAAACCLAEWLWGAGRGATRTLYLTCGSGFGAGLVIDGQIYRGARGRSPEIGHVRYRDEGPTAYGKRGCFEAFGAGNSLPRLAAWLFPQRFAAAPPAGQELAALAAAGDGDARAVLGQNALAVGDACALLGDLLVPDTIILGSLARYLGPDWMEQVRGRFTAAALEDVSGHCRVVPALLGARLQDCSALAIGRGGAATEAAQP